MAYAALVSLSQTLKQLLYTDLYHVQYPKPQIEAFYDKVCFLQDFLEFFTSVPSGRGEADDLETQIRDAIYEAQDTIELFISRQIRSSESEEIPTDQNPTSRFLQDLQEIIAKFDLLINAIKGLQRGDSMSAKAPAAKSSSSSKGTKIVGLEKELDLLREELMGGTLDRLIVTISGSPGIGKTTLVRSIYENPIVQQHFDILCWATVSQEYSVREICLNLLGAITQSREMHGMSEDVLGELLYKSLSGRRYLIVMDDVWDVQLWDTIKFFFPGNKNGNRVILTSRNARILYQISSNNHVMRPLDQEESWALLCENLFGGEDCPPELENIGRSIAEKCGGIPLSIVVIGGLLSREQKSVEYWRNIEEDVHGAAAKGAESYLEILYVSYNNLPVRLKTCFLYMGAFPKDSEIVVSKLVKLWVAEGFLTPPSSRYDSLEEEVAKRHLKDLIDRKLISICKINYDGQPKTCSMQGNLRQVAIEECQKDNFFHIMNRYVRELSENTESQRRISIHKNVLMCIEDVYQCTKSIKLARTLLYAGPNHHYPLPFFLTFELLRVLDALTVYFIELPNALFELIHLRYLAFTYDGDLPPSISELQNLQILIVHQHPKIILRCPLILPVEIWNMSQIRHLMFNEIVLPGPSFGAQNSVLLENIQSLSNVNAASCTKEVLRNMPNLKKLGIWIEAPGAVHFYLDQLQHLESLKFTSLKPLIPKEMIDFLPKLVFPKTLKKLSLSGCGLPWEAMTIIGKLPCLEVLKLRKLAFQGPKWCPIDGEFCKLKFLLLECLDLEYWDAEGDRFPILQHLIIRHCYELEEISTGIGEIPALKLIELVDCNPRAVECAQQIREEQESFGNEGLQVRIHSSWDASFYSRSFV